MAAGLSSRVQTASADLLPGRIQKFESPMLDSTPVVEIIEP